MLRRRRRVVSVELITLVFAFYLVACNTAKEDEKCQPSSCGNLHNISDPFRLKGDPHNCGDIRYELSCENNSPILYLYEGKYYVEAISYENRNIRIVDPGLQNGSCSSMPRYSLADSNFSYTDPYALPYNGYWSEIVFVNCGVPVNSTNYVDTSPCINSYESSHMHSYVIVGGVMEDIKNSCRTGMMLPLQMSSWTLSQKIHKLSFPDIHRELLMGIQLSWRRKDCEDCLKRGDYNCTRNIEMHSDISCYLSERCERVLQSFHCFWDGFIYRTEWFLVRIWTTIYDTIQRDGIRGLFWIRFRKQYFGFVVVAIIGYIVVPRTSCGILCLSAFLIYKFRRRHRSMDDTIEEFLQHQNNLVPIRYSYSEIKKMAKGFKDKLGQGGFGSVFKGRLRSGGTVAIKMLGKSKGNWKDFVNEVATIGRIHHVNVVQLKGFCSDGSKRALIYDFMPNGSLEKYIFPRQENNISLSWDKMYEIALGVARGIEYLHRGCEMQILHFDIKPHNILLDENFTPKISDFGLAKLYPTDDSIVSLTAARGTLGYMAPELFYKNIGGVSYKADVYSFGMLLMEMAGRRKNVNAFAEHTSQIYFPYWIYDRFTQGEDMEMGDATEDERKIAKKLVIVALWCIQMTPIDRPSMSKVLEMLEGNVELLQMPPKPFLSSPERMVVDDHANNRTPIESSTIDQSESPSCTSIESIVLNVNVD